MRRLLLILLATQAWSIALVQKLPVGGINGGNNTGTTVTCSNAAVTAGNMLFMMGQADTGVTLSISDTLTNTWTAVISNFGTTGGRVASFWYAKNIAGGADTVTVTASASVADIYCGGAEFSGLSTTAPLDQHPAFAVNTTTSSAVTTTQANEVLIGITAGGNGGLAPTAGTGYTLGGSTNNGAGTPGWEYQIVATTQTNVTATFGAATSVDTTIATFNAPVAGGSGFSQISVIVPPL